MRVIYWTERFRPDIGGVEVISVPLIHALQARGIDFIVVTSHGRVSLPDVSDFQDIPVHRFSFHRALQSRQPAAIRALAERLAELKQTFQSDLIHLNTAQPSLFFQQQTAAAHPCPTLVTIHEPLLSQERNSLLGRTLSRTDWVAAVSAAMLADVCQFMPELSARSSVIPAGMEMPEVEPTPLDWQTPRLLCFGRLVPEKGFDVALKAFARVAGQFPALRLRIAGDGTARPQLEALAGELKIRDVVEFTGWVEPEDIPSLINESLAVLMPSRWREPFGYVAVQTAQMARPIIATRVGGLPEIVVDGQTGVLIDPERDDQMADALVDLLTNLHDTEAMGQAARRHAQARFAFAPMVDAYERLYRQVAVGR